jgi:hypothetical protein
MAVAYGAVRLAYRDLMPGAITGTGPGAVAQYADAFMIKDPIFRASAGTRNRPGNWYADTFGIKAPSIRSR